MENVKEKEELQEEVEKEKVEVIDMSNGKQDGQTKCPKCGATDITHSTKKGKLVCQFCRHEFDEEKVESMEGNVSELTGRVVGTGAQDIIADEKDMITLKCTSCGAEVVIDTNKSAQSRCHWCRNTLSLNEQVPNGAVPDVILPFKVSKQEAQTNIHEFVNKRKFFAHPTFTKEFTTENINGVYFPYFIVDVNAKSKLEGQGEILKRRYTVSVGDNSETRYDADLYNVSREFDMHIDNLTVESNKDKLKYKDSGKTTNIINSIMPFDIENSVKWDANYIKGYTSEKRDTDVEDLSKLVKVQSKDIARHKANEHLKKYDRGVCWSNEEIEVVGEKWISSYLPVWLYSYQEVNGSKKQLHYVAVNARTKETMGSVPIHMSKLLGVSAIVEVIGILASLFTALIVDLDGLEYVGFLAGIIFFVVQYMRYRNSDARHTYEKETKTELKNIKAKDEFVKQRKGLSNARISGENGNKVNKIEFDKL